MDNNTEVIEVTKNLATCSSVEFLRQSNKIRHAVQNWLKDTKLMEIRKRKASGKKSVTNEMTADEKAAVQAENARLDRQQAKQNFSDMLDACLEQHTEETLRVLALMCFVEPKDADKIPANVLMGNFAEMLGDDGVMSFFISLMKWEAIVTSN